MNVVTENDRGQVATPSAQHESKQLALTIRRTMIALVVFALFCVLALSAPDSRLFSVGPTIGLPFADIEVSYIVFLYIGPLILVAICGYLHVFLGQLASAHADSEARQFPAIFNLQDHTARSLSLFLFYGLTPAVLGYFAYRGAARSELAPWLIISGTVVTLSLLGLLLWRARHWSRTNRQAAGSVVAVIIVLLAIDSAWQNWPVEEPDPERNLIFGPVLKRSWNLRGAGLHEADLRGVDLTRADLTEADISHANLRQAYLSEAILIGTNLAHTRLIRADFRGANLNSAKLENAQLEGADLRDTNLSHTALTNARMGCDGLFGPERKCTDLRGVTGLRDCSQLTAAKGWEQAHRDKRWACGADMPSPSD